MKPFGNIEAQTIERQRKIFVDNGEDEEDILVNIGNGLIVNVQDMKAYLINDPENLQETRKIK